MTNKQVLGLGITNQRETTLVWSRSTGTPLYNAIVWLDNRTRWVVGGGMVEVRRDSVCVYVYVCV